MVHKMRWGFSRVQVSTIDSGLKKQNKNMDVYINNIKQASAAKEMQNFKHSILTGTLDFNN